MGLKVSMDEPPKKPETGSNEARDSDLNARFSNKLRMAFSSSIGKEPLLSVVIIARNEAAHIASAIESVLRETRYFPSTEVVLVDSCSTDATVDIATSHPIGVLRLLRSSFLSAAAGRYIGYLNTSGQFILHLDGDMTLCPDWLGQAIPYLLSHPTVAGCSGYWENVYRRNGQIVHSEKMDFSPDRKIKKVNEFAGAALYRRSALQQVGGFNPYISSYEEPELCARLRHAGFQLVCLPNQICIHYGLPEHSLASYRRRWRNRLWVGCGQMLRYHLGKDTFSQVARLQGGSYLISTMFGLLVSMSLLVLGFVSRSLWPILAGVGMITAFFVVLLYRKWSLPRALLSLLLRAMILLSGIEGFLMSPRDPATYPANAEIVQSIPCTSLERKE